jgi:hypothetical protein
MMAAIVALRTSSTEALEESVALATASTSSALFMAGKYSLKGVDRGSILTGVYNEKIDRLCCRY